MNKKAWKGWIYEKMGWIANSNAEWKSEILLWYLAETWNRTENQETLWCCLFFRDDCNFIANPCPSEHYDQAGFEGPVLFKQVRVTTYGRKFKIWKFRTMVNHADKLGTQVTTKGDARITRMGHLLRKVRLDELPQLFNVLKGDMTFVGTRPEVPKYVAHYTEEMMATFAPSRCYFANKYWI